MQRKSSTFTFTNCWLHRTVFCRLSFLFCVFSDLFRSYGFTWFLVPTRFSAARGELTLFRRFNFFLLSPALFSRVVSLTEREERRRWWEGCRLRNFSTAFLPIFPNLRIWKNWTLLISFGLGWMYSPPVLTVVCVDLHQVSAASFTGLSLDTMKLLLSPFSCSIDLQRPWIPNKEVSTQRKLPSHSFHILCESHFTLDFQLLNNASLC